MPRYSRLNLNCLISVIGDFMNHSHFEVLFLSLLQGVFTHQDPRLLEQKGEGQGLGREAGESNYDK